jgi:hypothetical protein
MLNEALAVGPGAVAKSNDLAERVKAAIETPATPEEKLKVLEDLVANAQSLID